MGVPQTWQNTVLYVSEPIVKINWKIDQNSIDYSCFTSYICDFKVNKKQCEHTFSERFKPDGEGGYVDFEEYKYFNKGANFQPFVICRAEII